MAIYFSVVRCMHAGYWSSFPAPLVRESPRFKQALGYEQDDICMGEAPGFKVRGIDWANPESARYISGA